MGIVLSSASERGRNAEHVISESETMSKDANSENDDNTEDEFHDAAEEDEARAKAKEEEMNEFRKQLSIKREQRKEILARHKSEKLELEKSLKKETALKLELLQKNEQLRDLLFKNNIDISDDLQSSESTELTDTIIQMREEFDKLKEDNNKLRVDLVAANNSLQGAYSDIADLNGYNLESMKQIQALKEVVTVSKTLISLREEQLNELKEKLGEIEKSLSERESNMLSVDLRQEYERQLQNIRTLRGLYEERARLAEVSRQGLVRDLEEQKALYQIETNKCKDLVAKVAELEEKLDMLEETIEIKNNDISSCKDETNKLKAEMTVVNKLFSQVLLGYKTKQDLDKLVHRLEENHGLLTHMAEKEDDAEASSALPKLLLEIVSQVDDSEGSDEAEKLQNIFASSEDERNSKAESLPVPTTAKEIVENLPKVWRVLMELLSHQTVADDATEKITTCYKSVDTKSGPVLVPSVSQTYIRLKDLIVEKLGLIKEVNRMKQLNTHLESRLQEQEKRLCLVTTELGKTWHVVGKLRRHHYQLHTHEKILKYELQQKRKLLNELKEELEYCREKWEQAREKNSQSEKDWRKLRAEFTSRNVKSASPSFNNSGESGYSDERPSDDSSESNDESEYVAEPPNKFKKKSKQSAENIMDSSGDCHVAEREDPVSDMIDVADLSLDTQESEDNPGASSDCSKSDNIFRNEKTSETEDEIGDLSHDDVLVENTVSNYQNNITPVETIVNFTTPNHTLSSESSRENINTTLDNNIKKTSCSLSEENTEIETYNPEVPADTNNAQIIETDSKQVHITESNDINNADSNLSPTLDETPSVSSNNNSQSTGEVQIPILDFKAILESVKQQNEHLTKKDMRLKKLETDCADVVQNISNTLTTSKEIDKKLDALHTAHSSNIQPESSGLSQNETNDCIIDKSLNEPSTSTDIDHEARFAARDLRLRRLEEQTKSLVKKVNNTNSKGVKINYKLDELHNIYGSESSRAGTPSEDTEDRSIDEDPDSTKE